MLSLFMLWHVSKHQMVWTFSCVKENALDSPRNKRNKEARKCHEQFTGTRCFKSVAQGHQACLIVRRQKTMHHATRADCKRSV